MRPLAVIALLLALVVPAPGAQRVIELGADVVEVDQANERAEGQGHVWARFEGADLKADLVKADLKAGTMLATGDVEIRQRDRLLSAAELQYDLNAKRGLLKEAHGQMGPILFGAERADITPDTVLGVGASLTTCDRPHPHYHLTASRITITPGRATVKGATLRWHGRRILKLPQFHVPLPGGRQQEAGLVPKVGYARGDGPFFGLRYGWTAARQVDSSIEFRQTALRGTRGIARADLDRPWGQVSLALASKDDWTEKTPPIDDPRAAIRRFLVDKLPELRAEFDKRRIAPWLSLGGYVTAGRYLERDTEVRDSRTAATVFLTPGAFKVSGVSLEAGIGWRGLAAGGDRQTVLVSRISLGLLQTPRSSLRVSFIRRKAIGRSPFSFDAVEIERELSADAKVSLSHGWAIENVHRYDLDQRRFRDADIKVSRTAHCLRYAAVWLKARKEFRLQVELSAF
jgi:lipopolysaccharide export system protein LptA